MPIDLSASPPRRAAELHPVHFDASGVPLEQRVPDACFESVRTVYGADLGLAMTPSSLERENIQGMLRVIVAQKPEYGWEYLLGTELRLVSRRANDRDKVQYRYQQYYMGLPVTGGQLNVTFHEGKVTAIRNNVVPMEGVYAGNERTAAPEVGARLSDMAQGAEHAGLDATVLDVREQVLHVDRDACAREGTVAYVMEALLDESDDEEAVQRVVVAADSGEILDQRPVRSFAQDFVMYSEIRLPYDWGSRKDCEEDSDCLYTWEVCYSGRCLEPCEHSFCRDAQDGWYCRPLSDHASGHGWGGMCANDDEFVAFEGPDPSDWMAWAWPGTVNQTFYPFSESLAHTVRMDDTIVNVMGRTGGWSGSEQDYVFEIHDEWGASYAYQSKVHYRLGAAMAETDTDELDYLLATHTVGHEWGHVIDWEETGKVHEDDTLENIADMCGVVNSVSQLGTTKRYPVPTPELGPTRGVWHDSECGLDTANDGACDVRNLPYSLRSRFDAFPRTGSYSNTGSSCTDASDCPPYWECLNGTCSEARDYDESINSPIWGRFLRLVSQGSAAYPDEDLGVTFSGIGLNNTGHLLNEVLIALQPDDDWDDIMQAFHAEATAYTGGYTAVKYAAGLVGFIEGVYCPPYLTCNQSYAEVPRHVRFDAWNQNAVKDFWVYRTSGANTISFHYRNASNQLVTEVVPNSNTYLSPAVAVFNERLHIFWIDLATQKVKLYYIRYDGQRYSSDFSTTFPAASSVIDVATTDSHLYLMFGRSAVNALVFARCSTSTGCSTTKFEDIEGNGDRYVVTSLTKPIAMGMAAGAGLHGDILPSAERVYVVGASSGIGTGNGAIRVTQLNSDGDVLKTEALSTTSPSYRTADDIAVSLQEAAHHDWLSTNRLGATHYLHIAWADIGTGGIHKAVVQRLDNWSEAFGAPDTSWITRPDPLGWSSTGGVRFGEGIYGYGTVEHSMGYVFSDTVGAKVARIYGKY